MQNPFYPQTRGRELHSVRETALPAPSTYLQNRLFEALPEHRETLLGHAVLTVQALFDPAQKSWQLSVAIHSREFAFKA